MRIKTINCQRNQTFFPMSLHYKFPSLDLISLCLAAEKIEEKERKLK